MRNALGLMLASVVTAVVITGVWFWTSSPRADAAPPQTVAARKAEPLPAAAAKPAPKDDVEITASLSKPAPAPAPVPAAAADAIGLRQSRRAWRQPHCRDRHHRRSRLRLPAIQAVRFPHRQGSRAHLRRRSVADHARRAEGAGGRMHQGPVLPGRQAHHLSSGNSQAGLRRRPHRRLAHLVARPSRRQEDDRAADEGRDRERLQRREDGDRDRARAVLPLPRARAHAGGAGLSRLAQHLDVLGAMSIPTTSNHRVPTRSSTTS